MMLSYFKLRFISFNEFLISWGFKPKIFIQRLKLLSNNWIKKDLKKFIGQKGVDSSFYFGNKYFIWEDKFQKSGVMEGHYFHQDLFIAQKVFENNPIKHVDIGSRIDGFVAHVASFREIEILDIRLQKSVVKNITFKQVDFMNQNLITSNYCDSVSSLHSIEHFGLGRYGDPIDYNGHLKAIQNVSKLLQPNGKFYFSVPIGPQRIEFNAHRVFSVLYLLEILKRYDFDVKEFSYVDDKGLFFENVELNEKNYQNNFGCNYGCGIFICQKL